MNGSGNHTLLLLQKDPDAGTRTWSEHGSTSLAIEHIIGIYASGRAKESRSAEISLLEVLGYLDQLHDAVALVYDEADGKYAVRDTDFLKERITDKWQSLRD